MAKNAGTPEKVSQLRYIFRYNVVTADTKFIIEQAAGRKENVNIETGEFEELWPGYEFLVGVDEFTALLGTVYGRSIVDLIMTHPNELPGKSIASVTIFATEGDEETGEDYHMLWKLTD